jgi:hypothetical protein
MPAKPSAINLLQALRLWIAVFVLLFSQWVLAAHEHDYDHAIDDSCQYCQISGHFTIPISSGVSLTSEPNSHFDPVAHHSLFSSPRTSIYTARAPPIYS